MIDDLERLVSEIGALHTKLILLVGPAGSGKTKLLEMLANKTGSPPLKVGASLGNRIASLSLRQRQLQAPSALRELAAEHVRENLLLIDNIELLFDHSLKLDPLALLKKEAHSKRVVAVWPGELREGRLLYAEMEHPEHQDYSAEGLVTFPYQRTRNIKGTNAI